MGGGAAPLELLTISGGPNVEPGRQSWNRAVTSTSQRWRGTQDGCTAGGKWWRTEAELSSLGKLPLVKDLVGKRTQLTAGSKSLQRAGSLNVSHQRVPKTDRHSISRVLLQRDTYSGPSTVISGIKHFNPPNHPMKRHSCCCCC